MKGMKIPRMPKTVWTNRRGAEKADEERKEESKSENKDDGLSDKILSAINQAVESAVGRAVTAAVDKAFNAMDRQSKEADEETAHSLDKIKSIYE